jgi:hypothetical protein
MDRERPAPRSIVVDVTTSFHLDRLEKVTDRWRTKAAESARPAGSLDLLGLDTVNQAYAHLAAPVYARPPAPAAEPAPSLRALKRAQSSAAEVDAPPPPSGGGASGGGGALFAGLKLAAGGRGAGGGSCELDPPTCASDMPPSPSACAPPALFAGLSVLAAPQRTDLARTTRTHGRSDAVGAGEADAGLRGSTHAGGAVAGGLFLGLDLLAEPRADADDDGDAPAAAGAPEPTGARRVEAILAAYVQKGGAPLQPQGMPKGHQAILAAFVSPADGASRSVSGVCAGGGCGGGGGGGGLSSASEGRGVVLTAAAGSWTGGAAAVAQAEAARARDGDGARDGDAQSSEGPATRGRDGGDAVTAVTTGGPAGVPSLPPGHVTPPPPASLFAGLHLAVGAPEPPRDESPRPPAAGVGSEGGGCVGCPSSAAVVAPLFAGLHVSPASEERAAEAAAASGAGGSVAQAVAVACAPELQRGARGAAAARAPAERAARHPQSAERRAAMPRATVGAAVPEPAAASLFAGLQTASAEPPSLFPTAAAAAAAAASSALVSPRPETPAGRTPQPWTHRAGPADADAAAASLPPSPDGCSCEEILGVAEVGLGFLGMAEVGLGFLSHGAGQAEGEPMGLGAFGLSLDELADDDDDDAAAAAGGARAAPRAAVGVDWQADCAALDALMAAGAERGATAADARADASAALGAEYVQRLALLHEREADADALGARVREAATARRALAAELARAEAAAEAVRAAHEAAGVRKREAVAARRFKDAASEAAAERDAAAAHALAEAALSRADAAHRAADARMRALEGQQAGLFEQIVSLRHGV